MSAIVLLALRVILALLLYSFLGFVVYTLWRDMKQQGHLLAARQPPPLVLTSLAIDEPVPHYYEQAVIILGRGETCDFEVSDQTVSTRHARLAYRKQQWWLEDLASTNGTFLNGEAVTTPVVITHGDELQLGQLRVRVELGQKK